MNKLLYFGAEWCGPCKDYKPTLDQLDQDRVIRYDIDIDFEERSKYDIRGVPTLIIINENGEELERFLGGAPIEELQKSLG